MKHSSQDGDAFVDISFLVALSYPKDKNYKLAHDLLRANKQAKLITCDEVLAEYLNFFSGFGERPRTNAASAVREYLDGKIFEVIP